MKADRIITAVGVLMVIMSLLMMSVGKFIFGAIILLIAFAIFWNRGSGRFNDRSIYEKVIKCDLSIAEIYEKVKDIDTPFGKAWIAEHKGFSGDSIVFGPGVFKDAVIISRSRDHIDVKHITKTDNIIRGEKDEHRFRDFADPKELEVTPERYSLFAAFKLASVMLVRHLSELIEKLAADADTEIPESMDLFSFYYHNSSEGFLRDTDGDDILRVENSFSPFRASVLDIDGNEMASVKPHAFSNKGEPVDSAGYEMFADGEHFGEMRKFTEGKEQGFICDTDAGEFRVTLFPSCLRANISINYTIEHDGELKAVIGGSPNLLFDTCGRCQNDVILSYDDEYLVLYAIVEIFILTLSRSFLK